MAKYEELDIGQSVVIEDDAYVYKIVAWNQTKTKVWLRDSAGGRTKLVPIENVERWVE
jgi:hypothetical protein